MNIGIAMPVYGRPEITRLVLRHYARMDLGAGVRLRLMAVCSTPEDAEGVRGVDGWDLCTAFNEPLNFKHNAGFHAFRWRMVDAVMHVGSDCLLTPDYFRSIANKFAQQDAPDAVRLMRCDYYDSETGRMFTSEKAAPGSGTLLTRRMCDALDWAPWQGPPRGRRLDNLLYWNIREAKPGAYAHAVARESARLLEIKSKTNLWGFDEIREAVQDVREIADVAHYFRRYFPSAYETESPVFVLARRKASTRSTDQGRRTA